MRRGPGVAALGLACILLAASFAVRSLYVPGLALVLLATGAEGSVRLAARRTQLSREPLTATVEEDVPLRLTLHVHGRRFAFGGELSLVAGGDTVALRRLPPGPIDFTARLERRGAHVLEPSILCFRDPFGICVRSLSSPSSEVLVLPRVEPVRESQLDRIAALGRDAQRRASGAPAGEVDALRPYRRGTPAARIHWPTVARTGTLVERRLHTEADRLPLVVIDARRPANIDALDAAVRAAASLCVRLAQLGGCSLLLPNDHRAHQLEPDLSSWPALHARLALVGPGGAPSWMAIERAATVMWVSAAVRADPRVGHRSGAEHYLVSPFALAGRPVLFTVAGCTVQRAGHGSAARTAA